MGPILGPIPLPITGRIITVETTVGTKRGKQSLKALKLLKIVLALIGKRLTALHCDDHYYIIITSVLCSA